MPSTRIIIRNGQNRIGNYLGPYITPHTAPPSAVTAPTQSQKPKTLAESIPKAFVLSLAAKGWVSRVFGSWALRLLRFGIRPLGS